MSRVEGMEKIWVAAAGILRMRTERAHAEDVTRAMYEVRTPGPYNDYIAMHECVQSLRSMKHEDAVCTRGRVSEVRARRALTIAKFEAAVADADEYRAWRALHRAHQAISPLREQARESRKAAVIARESADEASQVRTGREALVLLLVLPVYEQDMLNTA